MKHLWNYHAVCHHCGHDGVEANHPAEPNTEDCPSGTSPNLHPLPEPDFMPYEREEWD